MLPDRLSPEKNAVTNDPAELRNLLATDFSVTRIHASLQDVTLRPDALVRVGGDVWPCTQNFLEDLAAAIGMPAGYAYAIDFELFRYNFDQRKGVKNRAVQVCLMDGRAVGLAAGEYRPARLLDVLDALSPANGSFWKLQKSSLTDRSVEVDLLSENFVVEPMPGDVIRAGIRVVNSETGDFGLKASLFTHRLACANGAVMSDCMGTVRWSYDNRVTYCSSIAKFVSGLAGLRDRQNRLSALYAAATDRPVLEEDVALLWRRVRTAGNFSPDGTDGVLGITAEERRRLATAVAERHKAGLTAEPSPWDVFTIHNRVTAAARTSPFRIRSHLERIGGDVLTYYSPN